MERRRGSTLSPERLSDDRLARAAAHGEPDAFSQIYDRYHNAVYGYCVSILGDPEEARDALQNTMEKALGAIATQRVTGGLKAWLLGIAHNEAISLTRTRPATQPIAGRPEPAAPASDPAQHERLEQLVRDLKTLPEQQRSALVLREFSGLGSAEIGSALGISPAAAKQAVYEARATLLAQSAGRDMDCHQVQQKLSENDGRLRRGRRLKAHLTDCALCSAFAAAIPTRRADMQLLFPPLGAALAAKTLAAATAASGAGGAGAGGGVAGAAGRSRKGQVAGAGTLAAVIAAIVVGALALGSPESDPAKTPPAKAAAKAAQPKASATPARPKAAQKPPAAPPAAAAAALASPRPSSTLHGYSDLSPGVAGALGTSNAANTGAGSAGTPAAAGSRGSGGGGGGGGGGTLPFTGLDLALAALAGLALAGVGAGMRRLARAPQQ